MLTEGESAEGGTGEHVDDAADAAIERELAVEDDEVLEHLLLWIEHVVVRERRVPDERVARVPAPIAERDANVDGVEKKEDHVLEPLFHSGLGHMRVLRVEVETGGDVATHFADVVESADG